MQFYVILETRIMVTLKLRPGFSLFIVDMTVCISIDLYWIYITDIKQFMNRMFLMDINHRQEISDIVLFNAAF